MSEKSKPLPEGKTAVGKRVKPGTGTKIQKSRLKAQDAKPKAQKPKPKAQQPLPKVLRLCGACQGQVAQQALYCRHCGKPLSADVPPNPHLPPPPKPWRPSRIPRHRPSAANTPMLPPMVADEVPSSRDLPEAPPMESVTDLAVVPQVEAIGKPVEPAPDASTPVDPEPDPLWAPIPEIEARLAGLRAMHERLRPMLVRSGAVKSRIRSL